MISFRILILLWLGSSQLIAGLQISPKQEGRTDAVRNTKHNSRPENIFDIFEANSTNSTNPQTPSTNPQRPINYTDLLMQASLQDANLAQTYILRQFLLPLDDPLPHDWVFQGKRLCSHPRNNAPALSFTLAGFRKGELDATCEAQLMRARLLGFTTVTVSPAFAFNSFQSKLLPGQTLEPGELKRCMEKTWQAGMDIVYKPHLDDTSTLETRGEVTWRANFDMRPDAVYEQELFGEFQEWLKSHAGELAKGERQVDVLVSAELERSIAFYPQDWKALVQKFKNRFKEMGFSKNVRLGFNPNWSPAYYPEHNNIQALKDFIESVDFIAPSFYGDVTSFQGGAKNVERKKQELLSKLSGDEFQPYIVRAKLPILGPIFGALFQSPWTMPQIRDKQFMVGEFGPGFSFTHAECHRCVDRDGERNMNEWAQKYLQKRRKVYQALLDWAKTQGSADNTPGGSQPSFINFWTVAVFDPVGVRSGRPEQDTVIADMLKNYTRWRCPGIQFQPPVHNGGCTRN